MSFYITLTAYRISTDCFIETEGLLEVTGSYVSWKRRKIDTLLLQTTNRKWCSGNSDDLKRLLLHPLDALQMFFSYSSWNTWQNFNWYSR